MAETTIQLDILTPLADHRALGILYHNLALEEARRHQWDEAIAMFKQALEQHRMVGNEDGLAVTYSRLGKAFLDGGRAVEAERCFNNASEHFIKLGNEVGEAACLRLLGDIYRQRENLVAAIRCLERAVFLDTRYRLPTLSDDRRLLDELRAQHGSARL